MNLIMKKITEDNFIDTFHLKLAPELDAFVSHPILSLAQAYVYYHQCTHLGIYYDERMFGYVMVIYDYGIPEYNIWLMMIDKMNSTRGMVMRPCRKCWHISQRNPLGIPTV